MNPPLHRWSNIKLCIPKYRSTPYNIWWICPHKDTGVVNSTPRNTWTSGGRAPCILSLDSWWLWVLGILPQLLYASGKDPKAHCKRDRMALRSSVDTVVQSKTFDLKEPVDFSRRYVMKQPMSVSARYKAWDCGLSLPGIAGSNPAGGIDVCLLWILCVVQVEVSASGRSLVQRSPTEYVCVCVCVCGPPCMIKRKNNPPRLQWVACKKDRPRKKGKKKVLKCNSRIGPRHQIPSSRTNVAAWWLFNYY